MRTKHFDLEAAKAGAKVVTRDGRPARIICFDKKDPDYPIVALVSETKDIKSPEVIYIYQEEGRYFSTQENDRDLFLLDESEPELTEFEQKVANIMQVTSVELQDEKSLKNVKVVAQALFILAHKKTDATLNKAAASGYKDGYREGTVDGKAEALKDLPKWRKFKDICEFFTEEKDCITTEPIIVKGLINDDDYRIIQKGVMVNDELYAIKISDLKKLSKEE